MGIVRAAIGLDDSEEEQEPTPPPHADPLKTTTTTTTTTPKPTDLPDTVYISGLLTLQSLVVMVFTCFVLATLIIKVCKRRYWLADPTFHLREYFFKLSTFHTLLVTAAMGLYFTGYYRNQYSENTCAYVWQYRWVLVLMVPGTAGVYALRYMAFGLASSDSFSNKGIKMPNPRVRTDIKHGWSADNDKFKQILGNYYTFAALLSGLIILLVFFAPSEEQKATLMKTSICMPTINDSYIDTIIFLILILFSTNFSAIMSEFLLRDRTEVDFFGVALNTPFVTTTSATTWISWYSVLFFVYRYTEASAGHYVLLLGYLGALDSVWCVMLSTLAALTKK